MAAPKTGAKKRAKAAKAKKFGTVTFGKVSRAKVSRAKVPRPDRKGPKGRAKVAAASRKSRARKSAGRVVDTAAADALAEALLEKERLRLASIEAMLRDLFARVCRLVGVEPADITDVQRPAGAHLGQWALGIYGVAARAAGCQWNDFSNLSREGLVVELRRRTHYSKMLPLIGSISETLEAPGKSPVLAALRDVMVVCIAHASAKMREIEAHHGPRPMHRPKRKETLAGKAKKAGKRAKRASIVVAKTVAKSKRRRVKAATKKGASRRPRQNKPNVGHDFAEMGRGMSPVVAVPESCATCGGQHEGACIVDDQQVPLFAPIRDILPT